MIFAVFALAEKLANHPYCYKYIYLTMRLVCYFLKRQIKGGISDVGQRVFCYTALSMEVYVKH